MAYTNIEDKRAQNRRWAKANPEKIKAKAVRYRAANGDKMRASESAWRKANPEKQRAANLKYEYGIAQAQYDAMLAFQENRCAICRTDSPGVGKVNWSVDHNHSTDRVRGLLCHHCNVGLGHFKDDALRLDLAAKYIREYE